MKKNLLLLAAILIFIISSGCRSRYQPVVELRIGLNNYLNREWEPVDNPKTKQKMLDCVVEIRDCQIYEGIDVLIDVWLGYDPTDSWAGIEARKTLVLFGERVLPDAKRKYRYKKYAFGENGESVACLKRLISEIESKQKKSIP